MVLLLNTNIKILDINDFEKLKMFHVKQFENYDISDESFYRYLNTSQYITLGAFYNDMLIGYVVFLVNLDFADIIYICVNPKYRRFGVASKMINVSRETICVFEFFLEVEINNLPAINFYKKNGFKIIYIRKKYINGSDAYLMSKKI